MIRTTSGPIEANTVGRTVLAHEHLMVDLRTATDRAGVLDDIDAIVDELRQCRQDYGLDLVVEQSCRGMGRDVVRVREIARAADLHVVMGTGYYYGAFHPEDLTARTVEELTADLVAEIENGMDGTDVRPGVLGEIGWHDEDPSPAEAMSLRAAGYAAVATGTPVATHAHLSRGGQRQLEVLLECGLAPGQIAIGHQDLAESVHSIMPIAAAGAYVSFDTVGKVSYQPESARLSMLLELLDAGYAERVLLSNDISRNGYLVRHGGTGYRHVLSTFRQSLMEAGVDRQTLGLLYRDNLVRFLSSGAGGQ